ncbi:hypothetical protein FRC19_010305 [Serendipita sp. 401]|nr:hypothetical protein FRC19_010305 [Serendipita sp. 401]
MSRSPSPQRWSPDPEEEAVLINHLGHFFSESQLSIRDIDIVNHHLIHIRNRGVDYEDIARWWIAYRAKLLAQASAIDPGLIDDTSTGDDANDDKRDVNPSRLFCAQGLFAQASNINWESLLFERYHNTDALRIRRIILRRQIIAEAWDSLLLPAEKWAFLRQADEVEELRARRALRALRALHGSSTSRLAMLNFLPVMSTRRRKSTVFALAFNTKSKSGRKTKRLLTTKRETTPVKAETFLDADLDAGYELLTDHILPQSEIPQPPKTKSQQDYFVDWTQRSAIYLDHLYHFEALQADVGLCSTCQHQPGLYQCTDCFGLSALCQGCVISHHVFSPFHRILKWNGTFFDGISSQALGIKFKIRHDNGGSCPNPRSLGLLTVIHTNGFHEVEFEACSCTDMPLDIQLFRQRLFPASIHSPKTLFSFETLEYFRMLHLEGKVSAHVFMESLTRLTTNEHHSAWITKDRVREFQRTARQWNYLITLKESIADESSALTTMCPACPQPGINIPHNWQDTVDPEKQWLFRQFVHFDANFRLVLEARPKRTRSDAGGLWNRNGFFVENQQYLDYLKTVDANQQNKSTCSDLRALLNYNRSRFQRLDITGIAGAVCRHDCAIPGSFVNLYKGERFVNSDYALSNIFKMRKGLKEIVVSYDIACQYAAKFEDRFCKSAFLNTPESSVLFLIPKFHLPSHREACSFRFSFNHVKGVGRTDGEGIERLWSIQNRLSGSTSKMTPGFRQDTLNLHFMDWNASKTRRMGEFQELYASINPVRVARWIDLENNFDVCTGGTNIFQTALSKAPSRATILASITQFEGNNIRRDNSSLDDWDTAAVAWVNDGLDIEETQASIRTRRSKINSGSMEIESDLLERERKQLWDRLLQWRLDSPTAQITGDDLTFDIEADDTTYPEDEPVILPSSLPSQQRPLQLAQIEQRLREGQANDALEAIRTFLAHRVALFRTKRLDMSGQKSNTRADAVVRRVGEQIQHAAAQYRRAYRAMLSLGMSPANSIYQDLQDSHLTPGSVFDVPHIPGQGRELSWIWQNTDVIRNMDDNWLDEVERVQFLDAKVHCDRWAEEVELLKTELGRTNEFFSHLSTLWNRQSLSPSLPPGQSAFCCRMAERYRSMAWDVQKYIEKSINGQM